MFLIGLFLIYICFKSPLYVLYINPFFRYIFCKDFLQVSSLCFHSLNSIFNRAEHFNLREVQLINFSLLWTMLKCYI